MARQCPISTTINKDNLSFKSNGKIRSQWKTIKTFYPSPNTNLIMDNTLCRAIVWTLALKIESLLKEREISRCLIRFLRSIDRIQIMWFEGLYLSIIYSGSVFFSFFLKTWLTWLLSLLSVLNGHTWWHMYTSWHKINWLYDLQKLVWHH